VGERSDAAREQDQVNFPGGMFDCEANMRIICA
jgi:hypothetical protein